MTKPLEKREKLRRFEGFFVARGFPTVSYRFPNILRNCVRVHYVFIMFCLTAGGMRALGPFCRNLLAIAQLKTSVETARRFLDL